MLKKLRVILAWVFWIGITLLFLDFTGALHGWLGWMAKIQLLPALLALNAGVVVALALLTLLFGRIYCSVICPLGVMQDGIAHFRKKPYKYHKEVKVLRYGVFAIFVVCLIAGIHVVVTILAPYSAYGRIVSNLFQPVALWSNNLFAYFAERAESYAFYTRDVWLKSGVSLAVAGGTLLIIGYLALRHGRAYCNSICPVGTALSFLSRFAMFRPVIDKEKCIHCKACEHGCKAHCISISKDEQKIDYSRCVDCFNCIDTCKAGALKYRFAWGRDYRDKPGNDGKNRRAFMAGAAMAVGGLALKGIEAKAKVDGGLAKILPKQAPERTTPITPPGSKSVKHFYQHCTGCQLCVAECPNGVLRPSANLDRLMQPEMSFERGFCRPECTRCSEVCPAGAIVRISKEEKTQYHVGTAWVNRELCVSSKGTHCGKCAHMCPVGAIMMVEDTDGHRIPAVDTQLCIGCGACEQYCPSRPISAITVNGREDHL